MSSAAWDALEGKPDPHPMRGAGAQKGAERSRARVTKCADTLVQRESYERRPRRLVDAVMVVAQRN